MAAYRQVYDSHHLLADCQDTKLPGSVRPFVINVPDSFFMSMVFDILCTKSPVEDVLQ